MANLFNKTQELKHVETTVGDFYAKPLPMSMIGWASKLSDPGVSPMEQSLAFSTILKAIAVDKDGAKLEDVQNMTAEDLSEAFPAEDLMKIVEAIMPSQEAPEVGNAA